MTEVTLRPAIREDAATIARLARELADYEKLLYQFNATSEDILRDGFGARSYFECLLAEVAGQAVGFALFYPNYSAFEGRPGLYLEDLYVAPRARGLGVGRKLVTRLAAIAVERGWCRLDLLVLHWNPARDFYHRLDMRQVAASLPYRLSGDALIALAKEGVREPT